MLTSPRPFTTEARVHAHLRRDDLQTAVSVVVDEYGAEVFGFLVGVLDDTEVASVVYADVRQRVASELATSLAARSLRTWMYWLARRELEDRRRRLDRDLERTGGSHAAGAVTQPRRLAGVTDAIEAVRRVLTEQERELLILRHDRKFDWENLARTEIGSDAEPLAIARTVESLQGRLEAVLECIEREALRHVKDR